jgi:hypothetical protein
MKIARLAKWFLGLLLLGAIGLYAVFAAQTWKASPLFLLSCMKVDPPVTAWTCRQALFNRAFQPEELDVLNRQAGARYAFDLPEPGDAEKTLALFISQGVDINAGDENANNWTALHGMVAEGSIESIRILLRHGARTDVRDSNNMTPLDFARMQLLKHPNDPSRIEVVKLVEGAT